MQIYKILLVDDEEEIRRSIIKRMKWEELGFSVVGEAENGIEALDIIDKTAPDLVITDIRMPFMDGIKLAENLHYRFPATKVIIISGFDEFEYAREAMKLGVVRYILKPINAKEMGDLLIEIKQVLDEEMASRNNLQMIESNYQKSLPFLKERFLNHWIEDYVDKEVIVENSGLFGLKMGEGTLGVAVIRPDELNKKEVDMLLLKNKSLLKVAIFNICEEIVQSHELGVLFMKMNEIVWIMPLQEEEISPVCPRVLNILEQIRIGIDKYLNTTVTIGVGNRCTDQSFLYKAYSSAVDALDYMMTVGSNRVIYIEDIEPESVHKITFEDTEERTLLAAIKGGREEEVKETLHRVLSKIDGAGLSLIDYQIYIVEIFSSLMRLARSLELESKEVLLGEGNFFAYMSTLRTKKEVKAWLAKVSLAVAHAITIKRNTSKNDLVEMAKAYIDTHYADEDLNAEKLCNHLHISTNYFSSLFKKETKMTFTTYLTQIRIEKAKELLRTTNLKTFDIGNRVGYTEGHYFSYVFKKVEGMAPTEYRNGKI